MSALRAQQLVVHDLVKIADVDAHEGPVYVEDEEALYFTTLPRLKRPGSPEVSIKRLALSGLEVVEESTVRASANGANGMALAPDGRLLVCEQGSLVTRARISAVDRATGLAETVVDGLDGRPFNSPNDVVAARDGTIWFTDPSYGFLQGFKPRPSLSDFVYRYDPRTADLSVVASDFDKPNGLAFSPDERVLYIGDSGANHERGSFDPRRPHHIRAFDVEDGWLSNDRVFAEIEPGFPDGLKVDAAGRVYASSFAGVQVFDPAGEPVGAIGLRGAVNFTFGGRDGELLFITADSAVWAFVLDIKGA
jgi:gluconolactonase